MLHAVANGLRLKQLRGIQHSLEGVRQTQRPGQIRKDLAVRAWVLLMILHHAGEDVLFPALGKGIHRLQARERLEAELRAEAEEKFAILRERLVAVPDIPIVDVAPVLIVGRVEAAAAGGRGRRVSRVRSAAHQVPAVPQQGV